MQTFSSLLSELYQFAERASLDDFTAAVVRLLHSCIHFDGAILGMGVASEQNGVNKGHTHAFGRDQSILDDYAKMSEKDPLSIAFWNGLERPMQGNCQVLYRDRAFLEPDEFAHKHRLHHMMIFGDSQTNNEKRRWIVLYKSNDAAFTSTEETRLHALWPHLSAGLSINRLSALDRLDSQRNQRALALVNIRGSVETADKQFLSLLQLEWPEQAPYCLPQPALECLLRGSPYWGRFIEIKTTTHDARNPHDNYIACRARTIGNLSIMTPKEYIVASRFASGLSHKQIANELGVSHHTIRTQLAQVYSKLGIHNKTALARYLATCA